MVPWCSYISSHHTPTCRSPRRSASPSPRPDRPDFDTPAFGERDLLGPLDRFVLRIALDQVEAAENLFGLREGPVGDLRLSRLDADAAALLIHAQAFGVDHLALAGCLQLGVEPLVASKDRLQLGLVQRWRSLVDIDEQDVAHEPSSVGPTAINPRAPDQRIPSF